MKKAYLPPLLLLGIMLAFCVWNGTAISKVTDLWQSQLRASAALAADEQWDTAAAVLEKSYADWTSHQSWLHIVCRHDALDDAEAMYHRAMAFAAEEESSEFRAETADLLTQLRLLAEMERFSLKNVL